MSQKQSNKKDITRKDAIKKMGLSTTRVNRNVYSFLYFTPKYTGF